MRRVLLRVLLAAIAVSGATPVVAQDAQVRFERGGALDADGAFRLHALAGTITVTGWDRDSVHVRGLIPKGLSPMAGGSQSGWKMSVYDGAPASNAAAKLEIFVPRGAQVWIKATSAEIRTAGLRGSLDLNTIEGDIHVQGSPSELRVETMRGDVNVAGNPGWLRLKSGAGSIGFTGSARDALLSTVSGAITSSGDVQRARVETVTGGVRIAGAIRAGSVLDVDSHSGDVVLALTAPVHAAFSVFTVSGRVVNKLNGARPKKAAGTGAQLDFTTGAGKARVAVRTFSGAVSILPGS